MNWLELFPVALFFISFFGLLIGKTVIKSIVYILLMQTSVILFWLMLGARHGTAPPIVQDAAYLANLDTMADPLPQALMLTAIIIGVSVIAINITMLNALFRKYHTADWKTLDAMAREQEDNDS
ncbi:MAG: cation:proton antiporter subunit C [Oscillospiraceae bacterium]|nr:cation:proton antiporter subunit C [Oscillospiraceae bacterium]